MLKHPKALSTHLFLIINCNNLNDWAISREVTYLGYSNCKICNPSTTTRQHPVAT